MGLFGRKKEKKAAREQAQENQGVLTLYACRRDGSDVKRIAAEAFEQFAPAGATGENRNFEIVLMDHSIVKMVIVDDPVETGRQIRGMQAFFSRAPMENTKVMEAALTQIGHFNCIVGITFPLTENEDRTNAIVSAVFLMAQKLSAFVLYPDMQLYHWEHKLLISIDGKTDMTEFYPVADANLLDSDTPETEADKARKARSIAICRSKGIPVIEHLRAYVPEAECVVPAKEDILRRAVCLFAAGICSEIFRKGGSQDKREFTEMTDRLEQKYQFRQSLSPREKYYLAQPNADEKEHLYYDWKYEACAVLLWALGLMEIGEPDHTCDVPAIGKLFWNNDFNSLSKAADLRSKEEILDMQDLILRYDWACVEARIKGGSVPALNRSVVYEWHYALNWLTGARGITEWDDVRPDT